MTGATGEPLRRSPASWIAACALLLLPAPVRAVPADLTPAQATLFDKVARGELCPCGLPMSLARCLEREDVCDRAKGAADVVDEHVRAGREYPEVVDALVRHLERSGPRPELLLKGRPRLGPEEARVVLVVFSDFQCPYCAKFSRVVQSAAEAFPGQVALVFKHLPLSYHRHAAAAAAATEVAHARGLFWKVHDAAFAGQGDLSEPRLHELLRAAGIDPASVSEAEWKAARERVETDRKEAGALGGAATPTLFLNGLELPAESYRPDSLHARIREELEAATKTEGE